jgi:biopolymer transport protein ExbD
MASVSYPIDTPEDLADSFLPNRKPADGGDFDMDITPMIDITFLLLIFFLVCSIPDPQTAIELPKARYGEGVGEKNSVIITLGDEGIDSAPIYLADGKIGQPIEGTLDQQALLIRAAIEKGKYDQEMPKENVLIKADRNVAHRDVARVIKSASKVEGMKIHLAVMETD